MNKKTYYPHRINFRATDTVKKKIEEAPKSFPERFPTTSQYIRAACIFYLDYLIKQNLKKNKEPNNQEDGRTI